MIRDLSPVDLTSAAGVAAASGRTDVRVLELPLGDLAAGTAVPPGPLTWLRAAAPGPGEAFPGDEALAALPAAGVIGMTLEFDARPEAPALIAFLVRMTSLGLPLEWGGPVADLPCELLVHLAPPSHGDAAADAWRAAHRYGLCYWRRGNGFAAVQDLRAEPGARYVIHEPDVLDLFHRLADPLDVTALPAGDRASLADLLDAELAVEIGGSAVRLPYRLRRWPVPVIDF
ncbi:DUF5825 family protein [Actinomadura roseirufa]|uniref:DUF5825 family protein n=1 Tax=Actinomadura roseirufa TaxID=2094049 RepID=UPI001041871E|nr:DUF5825 family protein [Actinomadura roseirufa]